jgi:Zn finger protein HypA/HybF involved in hydrogenase expression
VTTSDYEEFTCTRCGFFGWGRIPALLCPRCGGIAGKPKAEPKPLPEALRCEECGRADIYPEGEQITCRYCLAPRLILASETPPPPPVGFDP